MTSPTFLFLFLVAICGSSLVWAGEKSEGLGHQEALNNFLNIITADQNFYHLASAGLLDDSKVPNGLLEDSRDNNGNFLKSTFKFNSSNQLRKGVALRTRINFQDQLAFQVYDDQEDLQRARGPQVNQQLCGIHLDYMLYMINKFNANKLMETTEFSIWNIMQTFDVPILGLTHGNTIFPGDYMRCKETNLNIIKSELIKVVNEEAANQFFSKMKQSESEGSSVLNFVWTYLKPFFGYELNRYTISLSNFSDQVRTQPMRYCLAGLRWPNWPNSSFYKRNFVMRTATCLPETCDSSSLDLYYDKILKLTEFQMPNHALGYYIQDLYCLPDEKSELRNPMNFTSTKLLIAFNVVWFSLIIAATLIKFRMETKTTQENSTWWFYLSCWCLTENWNKFLCTKRENKGEVNKKILSFKNDDDDDIVNRSKNIVDFSPLEGWKFFGQLFIVCAHVSAANLNYTWNSDQIKQVLGNNWPSGLMFLGQATVNSFFVITAMISVRQILKNTPRKVLFKPKFWLTFTLYRYLRIVPYYLLIQWFWKSAFRFIGSGPLWDYGTSLTGIEKIRQSESWSTVFLLQANTKSLLHHFIPVGWYLALDIKFTLFFLPFLIMLYAKKPIFGYLVAIIGATLAIINHIHFQYIQTRDNPGIYLESTILISELLSGTLVSGYSNVQYRCASFLIGVATGFLLHQYESGEITEWPRAFVSRTKLIFSIYAYYSAFGLYIITLIPPNYKSLLLFVGSIIIGSFHGFSALVMASFLLLLCTGYYLPSLKRVLSYSLFRPFSNALLSLVLTHFYVIFYRFSTQHNRDDLTAYTIFTRTVTMLVETYICTIIAYVLFELPLRRSITKLLFSQFGLREQKTDKDQVRSSKGKKEVMNLEDSKKIE